MPTPIYIKTDLLVIPVREKQLDEPAIRALDRRLKGKSPRAHPKKSIHRGRRKPTCISPRPALLPAAHLLFIGLGSEGEIASDTWRKIGARARKEASALGAEDIAFFFAPGQRYGGDGRRLVEGALSWRPTNSTNTARIRNRPPS